MSQQRNDLEKGKHEAQNVRSKITKEWLKKNGFPPFFRKTLNDAIKVGLFDEILSQECSALGITGDILMQQTKDDDQVFHFRENLEENLEEWLSHVKRDGEHGPWLTALTSPRIIALSVNSSSRQKSSRENSPKDFIRQSIIFKVLEILGKIKTEELEKLLKEHMSVPFPGFGSNNTIIIGDKANNISNRAQQTVVHVHFYLDNVPSRFRERIKWNTDGYIPPHAAKISLVKRFPKGISIPEIHDRIINSLEWNMSELKDFSKCGAFTICMSDEIDQVYQSLNSKKVSMESVISEGYVGKLEAAIGGEVGRQRFIRGSQSFGVLNYAAFPSDEPSIVKASGGITIPSFCLKCERDIDDEKYSLLSDPQNSSSSPTPLRVTDGTIKAAFSVVKEIYRTAIMTGRVKYRVYARCQSCTEDLLVLKFEGRCTICKNIKNEFAWDTNFRHVYFNRQHPTGRLAKGGPCMDCLRGEMVNLQKIADGLRVVDGVKILQRKFTATTKAQGIRFDPEKLFARRICDDGDQFESEKTARINDIACEIRKRKAGVYDTMKVFGGGKRIKKK